MKLVVALARNLENTMSKTNIEVKQIRSTIGQSKAQRLVMKGLGLARIGKSRILVDTKAVRGMIVKVQHLVDVKVKIFKS